MVYGKYGVLKKSTARAIKRLAKKPTVPKSVKRYVSKAIAKNDPNKHKYTPLIKTEAISPDLTQVGGVWYGETGLLNIVTGSREMNRESNNIRIREVMYQVTIKCGDSWEYARLRTLFCLQESTQVPTMDFRQSSSKNFIDSNDDCPYVGTDIIKVYKDKVYNFNPKNVSIAYSADDTMTTKYAHNLLVITFKKVWKKGMKVNYSNNSAEPDKYLNFWFMVEQPATNVLTIVDTKSRVSFENC